MQREHPVTEEDLDAGGTVSEAALERWVTAARDAYLGQCPALRRAADQPGRELRSRAGTRPRAAVLGRPAEVVVTASAGEVRPGSFTISVRVRPIGGDREAPVDARWAIRLADARSGEVRELGREVRDELIALERSAVHFN